MVHRSTDRGGIAIAGPYRAGSSRDRTNVGLYNVWLRNQFKFSKRRLRRAAVALVRAVAIIALIIVLVAATCCETDECPAAIPGREVPDRA